jgi:hypothetical protein
MKELIDPQVIPKEVITRITKPLIVSAATGRPTSPEEGIATYGRGLTIQSYRGNTVWQHGGGVPGYLSLMTILPDKNIGITVMSNDDNWGWALGKITTYSIVDKLLGLEPVDHQGRTVKQWMGYLATKNPDFDIPDPPRPSLDPSIIVGKFAHKGYGELNIKRLTDVPEVLDLLPLIAAKSTAQLPSADKMFVTVFKNLFTHYIIFHALEGPKYGYMTFDDYDIKSTTTGDTATAAQSEQDGDVKNRKVIWGWMSGVAIFSEKGVGMFGGFYRRGVIEDLPKLTEEDVENNADVWFGRS